jgi:outer membrane receptor for ferrienterochelin and colicins
MKVKIILYLICIASFVQAQSGTLIVKVSAENQAIEFATVQLPSLQIGSQTDSAGTCYFNNLPLGKTNLKVSFIGYFEVLKVVDIKKGSNTIDIFLKANDNSLSELVVTGTMKEMSKAQSVVPVEIYTAKFFQRNPAPTLFEAMQNVNGVRPQMQCNVCNTGDIHINGMEGPYTMVLIDGMPIVSGLSTVYGLNGIPSSIIQRVEVVKGPAAALYGSEAMGGIINVITKSPKQMPKISLDMNVTSYQELNSDMAFRYTAGKKLHGLFSANYFHFDKQYDINNDNFTDITLAKRLSLFNKWSLDRKDNRLANLAFRFVNENRFGGELQWTPQFRGTDSIYGEVIDTRRWEIIGNYQLPTIEKLTLQYSINGHQQRSHYGTTAYDADQTIAFAQLLWDKRLNEKHDLLFGIGQRFTYYDDNTAVTASQDFSINKPQRHLLTGGFLQDEISWNSKIKVLLGARYDYSNIHGHILSPRASMKWKLDDLNALRLSAGNGFRVVNVFSEDHAALTGGRTVVFLDDLSPERSWNGNINFTRFQTFRHGFVNLDASLFYTYYHNRIIADYLSDPNKVIYDNLNGFAYNYGFALSSDFTFKNGLKSSLGATFVRSYIHENNERQAQIQTPYLTLNYTLSYTIPRWNIGIDFTGYINSPMILPTLPNDYRPTHSPWFNISNLQLTKKWKNGLEIYGGLKNIFNFIPREDPIMRPFDPFDKKIHIDNPNAYTFDPSYNYAPIQSIRGFIGLRLSLF